MDACIGQRYSFVVSDFTPLSLLHLSHPAQLDANQDIDNYCESDSLMPSIELCHSILFS